MQCNVEFGYQFSISSKTKENRVLIIRPQNLPDAKWLLARSPALNTRNLTLVAICTVALFAKRKYIFVFTDSYVHNLNGRQTAECNICGENTCLYACMYLHICAAFRIDIHPFVRDNAAYTYINEL
jgi:hypothetical protein